MIINTIQNSLNIFRKRVIVGKKFHSIGRVYFHGKRGRIKIGDNVLFISSPNINPTGGGMHIHIRAENNGNIIIGNRVGITRAEITSFNSIIIENDVLLGGNVKIWDTDFHPIKYQDRESNKTPASAPVLIKEGAFIGACSIILKGVTVGKHAVVGAGSVVTKNIPDEELWAGNPAKYIKTIVN